MPTLRRFILLWFSTCLALWIVDGIFESLQFDTVQSLLMAGLILALVNLTIKPILVLVTLPLTILSFGLALPLINGLVLLGVAALVPGFVVSGFWMGVLCALTVSVVGFLISAATGQTRLQGAFYLHGRGPRGPFNGPDSFPNGGSRSSGRDTAPLDPNTIDVDAREKESKNNRLD